MAKKSRQAHADARELIARFEAERELKRRRPLAAKAAAQVPVILVGGRPTPKARPKIEALIRQNEKAARLVERFPTEYPGVTLKQLAATWPTRPGAPRKRDVSLLAVYEHHRANPADRAAKIATALGGSVKTVRTRLTELARLNLYRRPLS